MPKLNIDGKEIEVEKGTRIIEAAKKNGIDIPFYCYHPGLSVAGNCRMCLVEIEKMPKLQISCHMECQDGMVVRTNTEKVLKTRQHVLEFLLVNHPLDCPVCDQAGECWLQDYYMKHGAYESRVNEDKIKKVKAVPVGEHVMLDAERCILCSRCVRFTDEISKTSEFGIVNRGDHSEISVFPGKELKNPYSGNVVDICPVGALTDRDFRFKMRVWYLKEQDSICNGCSRGCNTQVHFRTGRQHHAQGERVMRLKPRFNENINKWWMCDEGRYGYKFHDQNRITQPMKRLGAEVTESSWDEILSEVSRALTEAKGKIGVFISPQMSNEEIYLAKKYFSENIKAKNILLVSPNAEGFQDDFLIRADKNPNAKGAEAFGLKYDAKALEQFFALCEKGEVEGLVVFGQDLFALHGAHLAEKAFKKLKWTVFIGSNHNLMSEYAAYVLPSSTYIEKEGTWTNFEGKVQKFNKILTPLGEARAEWEIIADLSSETKPAIIVECAEMIFDEIAKSAESFKGLTYAALADKGGSDIRTMAMPTIPALEKYADIL